MWGAATHLKPDFEGRDLPGSGNTLTTPQILPANCVMRSSGSEHGDIWPHQAAKILLCS